MTTAPLSMFPPDAPAPPPKPPEGGTLIVATRLSTQRRGVRTAVTARLTRRRWVVSIGKRLLPLVAVALLASVVLWPQLAGDNEQARVTYRRGAAEPESGQMKAAKYHGVDAHGQPYTVTAVTARQVDAERINLTEPQGDLALESGNWLTAHGHAGVYLQHAGSLDLSGDVWLYRDDGTTLTTDSATLDLKQGAAAGAEMTHAEGPFGILDAQGFAVTDRGAVIRFSGPGRLVLNAAHGAAASPADGNPDAPPAPPVLSPTKRP